MSPQLVHALRQNYPGASMADIAKAVMNAAVGGDGTSTAPITPMGTARRGEQRSVRILAPGERLEDGIRPRRLEGTPARNTPPRARPTARPPATLATALTTAAKEQDEDAEIIDDFRFQKERPGLFAYSTFRNWAARKTTVLAAAAMTVGGAYVRVLYGLTRWDGRAGDEHDGRLLAAVGERSGC